jgi:hypothetical protein
MAMHPRWAKLVRVVRALSLVHIIFSCARAGAQVAPPIPREYSSLAFIDHHVIVFGGKDSGGAFLNDVHIFDIRNLAWSGALYRPWCCTLSELQDAVSPEVGAAPSPRYQHTASSVGMRMYIFGGATDAGLVNDVRVFDAGICLIYASLKRMTIHPLQHACVLFRSVHELGWRIIGRR